MIDRVPLSVTLNGTSQETRAATLAGLVAEYGLDGTRVATALNGDFVPAAARATTPLAAGDRVEIVSARQGG